MLIEKFSAAFSVLMIPFMTGYGQYITDQLDLDFWL
jgi:hypothetical protein